MSFSEPRLVTLVQIGFQIYGLLSNIVSTLIPDIYMFMYLKGGKHIWLISF